MQLKKCIRCLFHKWMLSICFTPLKQIQTHWSTLCQGSSMDSTIIWLMGIANVLWVGGGHNHTNSLLLPSWQKHILHIPTSQTEIKKSFSIVGILTSHYKCCFQTENFDKLIFVGIRMVKYASWKHLLFWKVSIKYTLIYGIHEYYLNQWWTLWFFFISLHNIEESHVIICI